MPYKEHEDFEGIALPVHQFPSEFLPVDTRIFMMLLRRIRELNLKPNGLEDRVFYTLESFLSFYREHGLAEKALVSLAELIGRMDVEDQIRFIGDVANTQGFRYSKTTGEILRQTKQLMELVLIDPSLVDLRKTEKDLEIIKQVLADKKAETNEKRQKKEKGEIEELSQNQKPLRFVEFGKLSESALKSKWLEDVKKRIKPARLFEQFTPDLTQIREKFPNFSEFIDEVAYQVESGNFSPILLVGPPGIGKTHIQSELARALSFPYFSLNIASADSPWSLSGSHGTWHSAAHSDLLYQLLIENTDFMYVFLDEINANLSDAMRNHPIGPVLLDFFDSGNRFRCNNTKHEYSTANFIKVAAVNDMSTITKQLQDRFTVIKVTRPTLPQRIKMIERMMTEEGFELSPRLIELLASESRSMRSIQKEIKKLAHKLGGRPANDLDIARLSISTKKDI